MVDTDKKSGNYQQAKFSFMRGFIGFLILTALVAVATVIQGEFGDLEAKILVTSLTISIASVCSMSCAAYLERGGVRWAGFAGIVFAFAGGLMLIGIVWLELTGDLYVKTNISLIIGGFSFAHGLLLLLPNLNTRYKWVQKVMVLSVTTLALMAIVAIWLEIESEIYFRFLLVVAIAVGLVTVVIPLLFKIQSGQESDDEDDTARLTLTRTDDGTYLDEEGNRYRVDQIREQK